MNAYQLEQFPFDTLEEYGLTREMIEDLPEHVLDTVINGGRSPLLPIRVNTKYGYSLLHAKFRIADLSNETGKLDIIFYPRLSEAPIQQFGKEEQTALLDGKIIVTEMTHKIDNTEEVCKERCYVQLDRETNHVFYVATPIIARNLIAVDNSFNLTFEDYEDILAGKIVSVQEPEYVTIGVDLFTETGLFVCAGDELAWKKVVGKRLPKYSFGLEGCWINEKGALRYVKEEDFDIEIVEARHRLKEQNEKKMQSHANPDTTQHVSVEEEKERASQLSR